MSGRDNDNDWSVTPGVELFFLGKRISVVHADAIGVYYQNVDTSERKTITRKCFDEAILNKDICKAWPEIPVEPSSPSSLEWLSERALSCIRFRQPYAQYFAVNTVPADKKKAKKLLKRIAKQSGHSKKTIPGVSTVYKWGQRYRLSGFNLLSLLDKRMRTSKPIFQSA